VQGPEPYVLDLGLEFACAVHPDRGAVLDSRHRVFVNYETYYVSDSEALGEFQRAPHLYAGRVTDPVTRERFVVVASSMRREFGERIFYFASPASAETFDGDPEAYATPMIAMRPAGG
jgi:YHS domain-containing protein